MTTMRAATRLLAATLLAALALVGAHAGLITISGARGGAQSESSDFAARCAEPEVVTCVTFDTDADFEGEWGDRRGVFPTGDDDVIRAIRDTSVKVSGASSLRFDIPAMASADSSGSWFTNFTDDLSFTVGEGDTVYIQWRQRIDQSILDTTYTQANGTTPADGIKLADISAGDKMACSVGSANSTLCPGSCFDFEVVVQNVGQNEQPVMYANCSDPNAYHGLYGLTSNITVQNGVGCLYPDYDAPPCVKLHGDEWMTFQVRITVGNWNAYDSTIQLWVAREGGSSVLVVDCSPTASDKCNAAGQGDVNGWRLNSDDETYEIGKVWLLPYQTNRSDDFTYQAESVWYDDLIISTARIDDPE